ncbi:MAG: ADP-ribosylation factor-like protein [Candidatus Helarchaeota archaeon]
MLKKNYDLRQLYRGEKTSTTVGFDLGHLIWARPNENSEGVIMSLDEFLKEKSEYAGWLIKKIEIKGSPGQLHFKDVRNMVARGSDGVLFVIDSSDPNSIGNALTLIAECKCMLGENVPMVVVANKQDLEEAITPEEISDLIKEKTRGGSARNNFGIKEAIIQLLRMITGEIVSQEAISVMEEIL